MAILPTIDETPGPLVDDAGTIVYEGFPADVLYEFRLYSLGTQAVIYATIGLVFAALVSRLIGESRKDARRRIVSEVVRLTLVSHAMTDAMAAGRFPTDEPLNSTGRRQVDASIELGETGQVFCGPEQRTRQTAELLGVQPVVESKLADLDCGRWRGDVLGGVPPAELAIWLTDPTRAPHGGESVVDLIDRVSGWMQSSGRPPRPDHRGHPPGGDSCGDPRRAGCAAEVVLAHRHRTGQPHRHALARARVDTAVVPVTQPIGMSSNACFTTDISQPAAVLLRNCGQFNWKLTTQGCPVWSTAYQLNVRSPGRLPALAPM